VPIRIQRYDDGHGPSGLCPSYGFFATIGLTRISHHNLLRRCKGLNCQGVLASPS